MKEKRGEHPFGDVGQLMLVTLFLVVGVGDSFFFFTGLRSWQIGSRNLPTWRGWVWPS